MTKKDEYIDRAAAQLKEWSAELDRMHDSAERAAGERKQKMLLELDELLARKGEAQKKLDQLRQSSGESWKVLSEGMDKVWGDLKDTFNKISEKFKQRT